MLPEPTQPFLRACRGLPVDTTPVWFMRQAGRYMSEYQAIRARHSLLEICHQPELAAEVTLQPVKRLGVDAAILFADILLPLTPMGIHFDFAAGEGPVIHNPIRGAEDVAALRLVEPRETLAFVLDALRLVRGELGERTPLIGFAGAPFTLASYLIEGGSSRNYLKTKRLMYNHPDTWRQLMQKLADVISAYLEAQVEAGAQAVQLFDSWVGALSGDDYRQFVQPYSRQILAAVKAAGVPSIHFGAGTASLLPLMQEAGGDVIGIDWQTPLDWAWERLGYRSGVQGNLDPAVLFAPTDLLDQRVQQILARAAGRPGYIFNLGHGILPETPVDAVRRVVERVHEYTIQPVSRSVEEL